MATTPTRLGRSPAGPPATPTVPTDRRPIGFWLRLVDRLLDERADEALAAHGLDRRAWQVLNVLHQGGGTSAEIDARVAPFLGPDEPTVAPVLDRLATAGWARRDGDRHLLASGRTEQFDVVHAELSAVRRQVVGTITADEYAAVVGTLERMATNLGWDGSSGD